MHVFTAVAIAVAGSAGPPAANTPVPRSPARLAKSLTATTFGLRTSVDRWLTEGNPAQGAAPRELQLYALYQQRIEILLSNRDGLFRTTGATKAYGTDGQIVDELSWTFAPERLHVVAGPSGSGKTTLLNLLAGLDYPDQGEIWIGGERIDALNPNEAARFRQRMVGYVSQHSTLVEFLSARENVELALALRGFDEDERAKRALRWLEWVGLGKLVDRRADRLSGGEQRRVAVARALAPAPRVLIADEPTAHLDRLSGRMVIRLLQRAVREGGTTVVAASHDPDVVAAADSTLVLAGRGR